MKEGDSAAAEFPSTTAGLQAAIDYLEGGKGKVFVGPGTLSVTTAIYPHSNCHIQGSGIGATVIQRATGSLTAGDAQYTGNAIFPTPYGTNGTPATSAATAVSNITLSDLTLDGNYTAFPGINPATPRHMGLYAVWCDGVYLKNVDVRNFLQTAIQFDTCRRCFVSDSFIYKSGQYVSASSRNGINFINNQNGYADDFGRYLLVENVLIESILDEAFSISNTEYVTVSNCICKDVDIVIELEGTAANGVTAGHYTFSNITAKNNTAEFFKWAPTATGVTLSDVLIENCKMEGSASHINDTISLGSGASCDKPVSNIGISNCIFTGCNTGDVSGRNFLRIAPVSTSPSRNITVSNCTWQHGLTTSTRTDCDGIRVFAAVKDLKIIGCNILDAAGIGISFDPLYASMSDITIRDTLVSDSTKQGIIINSDTGAFDVKRVTLDNLVVRDPCEQSGTFAFDIEANNAASTVSGVHLVNCRAVRTGSNAVTNGIKIHQQAGGATTTDITMTMCDFSGCTGANLITSGAPTNLRFTPRPGRGSDITAAATVAIPVDGTTFHVTGNTNVTNGITVNPWDNGRTVTLIFEGTPTVSDTGTSKLNGNFVAAGTTNDFDTLTLVCDGTNWTEVARSAN